MRPATRDRTGRGRDDVGLVAGVDVVGPGSQERAPRLLEALVERGALAGLTGSGGDGLKVRPPLVWEEGHVDALEFLTAAVDDVQ